MTSFACGVDFGTAYSCVAIERNGRADLVANEQGEYFTPSIVAFSEDEPAGVVGEAARAQAHKNAHRTVHGRALRELLGRKMDDPFVQRGVEDRRWPFALVEAPGTDGAVGIDFGVIAAGDAGADGASTVRTPRQVLALLLEPLYRTAAAAAGFQPSDAPKKKGKGKRGGGEAGLAVLAVPANADSDGADNKNCGASPAMAAELIAAACDAGFGAARIVRSGAASALAFTPQLRDALFGPADTSAGLRRVVLLDWGASALHTTTLQIGADGLMELLPSSQHLDDASGDGVDRALFEHFAQHFEQQGRAATRGAKAKLLAALQNSPDTEPKMRRGAARLLRACERAKEIFGASGAAQAAVAVDGLVGERDLHATISRARLEARIASTLRGALTRALTDRVHAVILAGGGAALVHALPSVSKALSAACSGAIVLGTGESGDAAAVRGSAARGAAEHGAALLRQDADSAVAAGEGEGVDNPLCMSCAPHTLSVAGHDGVALPFIARGDMLPARSTRVLRFHDANASAMPAGVCARLSIFEGESALAARNRVVGELRVPLDGAIGSALRVTVSLTAAGAFEVCCAFADGEDDNSAVSITDSIATIRSSATAPPAPPETAPPADPGADPGVVDDARCAEAAQEAATLAAWVRHAQRTKISGAAAWEGALVQALQWLDGIGAGDRFDVDPADAPSLLDEIKSRRSTLQQQQRDVVRQQVEAAKAAAMAKAGVAAASDAGGDDSDEDEDDMD